MRVLFLGSPDFAVASLNSLLASRHEVVGVITQPDRPAGRGMKLQSPPVKNVADVAGIDILQPESVNKPEVIAWIQQRRPDVLAVVAYGEFLGSDLLQIGQSPPINVHPSMLPLLRGAAPIQWAVIRGFKETGVTTQFMVKQMDAGDILLQEKAAVDPNETSGQLHDRLKVIGARLLVATIHALEAGELNPTAQDDAKATLAPLLKKSDGIIEWDRPAEEIHNLVRGLQPWPSATTTCGDLSVKVLRTELVPQTEAPQQRLAPGEFCLFGDDFFVGTATGSLKILELQPSGKRPQLPKDFANGIRGKRKASEFRFGPST